MTAYLGDNGVTWNKRDGDKATPAGEFDILYYIGINDRGSNLKYVPISDGDVWVCDPDSLYYNTMQRNSGTRDWDAAQAENLYRKFHDDYSAACIMFNYNGDGLRSDTAVSGKGSDIFIDGVAQGQPDLRLRRHQDHGQRHADAAGLSGFRQAPDADRKLT